MNPKVNHKCCISRESEIVCYDNSSKFGSWDCGLMLFDYWISFNHFFCEIMEKSLIYTYK